jgi:hypothetical protein
VSQKLSKCFWFAVEKRISEVNSPASAATAADQAPSRIRRRALDPILRPQSIARITSCFIDGEAIVVDGNGFSVFELYAPFIWARLRQFAQNFSGKFPFRI